LRIQRKAKESSAWGRESVAVVWSGIAGGLNSHWYNNWRGMGNLRAIKVRPGRSGQFIATIGKEGRTSRRRGY
jgi:hypothetical protein